MVDGGSGGGGGEALARVEGRGGTLTTHRK